MVRVKGDGYRFGLQGGAMVRVLVEVSDVDGEGSKGTGGGSLLRRRPRTWCNKMEAATCTKKNSGRTVFPSRSRRMTTTTTMKMA